MYDRLVHGLTPRDRVLLTALAATTTWGTLPVSALAGAGWGIGWLVAGTLVTLRFRRARRTDPLTGAQHSSGGPDGTGGVADAQERVLQRLRSMASEPPV